MFATRARSASLWASLTKVSDDFDETDGTSYSFTGKSFGAADSGRRVVVCLGGTTDGSTGAFTSGTIGGVSATLHAEKASSSGNKAYAAIISAAVPTGTTGTVALTMNADAGGFFRMYICVYRLVGFSSTVHATDTDEGTGGDLNALELNTPSGGGLVAIAAHKDATADWTWSGSVTVDHTLKSGDSFSAASLSPTGANTPLVLDPQSATSDQVAGAAVSWAAT